MARRHLIQSQRQPSWSLFDDPWLDILTPTRIFDQHFGQGLTDDDFQPPTYWRGMQVRPRTKRPAHQTGLSEVANDEKEFKMMMDVSHFAPDEITVKCVENRIVVNAKHEEKEDEHGFIERSFTRQFVLPKNVDTDAIQSSLTADGVLVIKAAKKAIEPPKERVIPVEIEPAEKIEDKEGATGGKDTIEDKEGATGGKDTESPPKTEKEEEPPKSMDETETPAE